MLQLLILGVMLSSGLVMVEADDDMGPGVWNLKHINKCELSNHKFKFDVEKKKYNRTHDCIDAYMLLEEDFTDSFAVYIDICKYVDGGCKSYQVMSDNSLVNFVNKYAQDNVRSFLEMANIDPPEFPIPAGEYEIKDYMFSNEELPSEGPYGEYCAKAYMLRGYEEIGCVEVYVEFIKEDDCDD